MSTSAVTQEAFNLFDVLPKWDHFAFSTKGRAIKFLNSNGYSSNLSNTVNFEGFGGFGGEKGKPKVFASLVLSKSSARIQRILNDFNRVVQLHCDRIPFGFGSSGLSTGESGLREVGVEKPKKVLILMSDTGGGHRASAEAIKVAFHEEFGEEYQVFITDLWSEHTRWPFNQLPRSYNFLVKHATLWRATYYLSAPRSVHQTNFAFWSPFIARERRRRSWSEMTKFNVIQKKRRAQIAERKRQIHGDPLTGKLKLKQQPVSISGKRKRKLFKKWRRDQKEAIQKGLVSMEDVQISVAEGTSQDTTKPSIKFPMKKGAKLKIKHSKRKGKDQKKKTSTPASENPLDSMVE